MLKRTLTSTSVKEYSKSHGNVMGTTIRDPYPSTEAVAENEPVVPLHFCSSLKVHHITRDAYKAASRNNLDTIGFKGLRQSTRVQQDARRE